MRKNLGLLLALAMLGAFFVSYGPLYAQDKGIRLRYSSFYPPVHPVSKLAEEWCKEIEKRTNGRVKFTYFPGNTLTPPTQTYDSVATVDGSLFTVRGKKNDPAVN
jgi:TRAP-type C4-dicarboxylate transport system substrate-binding protein